MGGDQDIVELVVARQDHVAGAGQLEPDHHGEDRTDQAGEEGEDNDNDLFGPDEVGAAMDVS